MSTSARWPSCWRCPRPARPSRQPAPAGYPLPPPPPPPPPPPGGPYQAEVSWWAATPHLPAQLDARLLAALIPWLHEAWAFTWAGFRANQHEHRHLQLYEAAGLAVRYTIDIPREPGRFYLYG